MTEQNDSQQMDGVNGYPANTVWFADGFASGQYDSDHDDRRMFDTTGTLAGAIPDDVVTRMIESDEVVVYGEVISREIYPLADLTRPVVAAIFRRAVMEQIRTITTPPETVALRPRRISYLDWDGHAPPKWFIPVERLARISETGYYDPERAGMLYALSRMAAGDLPTAEEALEAGGEYHDFARSVEETEAGNIASLSLSRRIRVS